MVERKVIKLLITDQAGCRLKPRSICRELSRLQNWGRQLTGLLEDHKEARGAVGAVLESIDLLRSDKGLLCEGLVADFRGLLDVIDSCDGVGNILPGELRDLQQTANSVINSKTEWNADTFKRAAGNILVIRHNVLRRLGLEGTIPPVRFYTDINDWKSATSFGDGLTGGKKKRSVLSFRKFVAKLKEMR